MGMTMRSAETVQVLWPNLVQRCMNEGREFTDERGEKISELLNVTWNIKYPMYNKTPEKFPMGDEGVKMYEDAFLNPNNPPNPESDNPFIYTYGNRLRNHFSNNDNNVDQVAHVIERLRNNHATRRAIMVTFNPVLDFENDEIPCCIVIDSKIRDDKLYLTVFFRSNDLFGAYPANVMGLTKLQQYIAGEAGVKLGEITGHAVSLHIYGTDFDLAKDVYR